MKSIFNSAAIVLLTCASFVHAATTITINAATPGPEINPRMYGIFLEEINHGVDGGLYAELIRNRAFEDSRPPEGYTFRNGRWRDEHGFDSGFSRYGYTTNGIPFWSLVQSGDAKGEMHLETTGGVTDESSYCLRLNVENATGGRIGVANEGFFGIGVKQGETYTLSLYARGDENFTGSLTVRLEDASGNACSSESEIKGIGREWKQFKAAVTGSKTDSKARFVITAGAKGTVWLDFVSLFPKQTWKDRANGLRPDIAQMIADLKPGFVRFPGGCVVEAGTVETAYNWKLTVGPLEKRSERWGPWNYRRTQGMGLYEYLQFCENVGAEPLYVGFAGQTCIFRERENVPMDQMDWVRDNFLDVVEYANGSADSKWGGLRAEAGHRAPFELKYVEIGNENQGREFGERYHFIHEAMKAKYPDLKYFADLSWTSRESLGSETWNIEDRHYYNSPAWFVSHFNEYDRRERTLPPLYLGEVAVTSGDAGPFRGNLNAALSEGVFLLGCERNADAVSMVSYAPLLAHVDGRTELINAPPPWHGMIYFDGTRVFGTASYYLWKTFSENRPNRSLQTQVENPDEKNFAIAGQIGLGTWDTSAEFKDVRVEKNGEAIYASDFGQNTSGWQSGGRGERGQWEVQEGAYRQSRAGRASSYYGDESWSDYTLTLKARKLSGGEGFLIMFGRKGRDLYWWNLGGWGNSRYAIEHSVNGAQMPIGPQAEGHIEIGRWYDIKIALNKNRIQCYLDGKLVHDEVAQPPTEFFALAGRDEAKGEIVLKAINLSAQPMTANLKILGANNISPEQKITVLTSASSSDNNSLDQPKKVVPAEIRTSGAASDFTHEFPARSLTVLRVKTK
jgi:alpha-L-arabinofuranosidase